MRISRALVLVALPAAIAAGTVAVVGLRVHRVLSQATASIRQQHDLSFDLHPLSPIANPGFETISSPAAFHAAAFFNGQLYIDSPASLAAYTPDGQNSQTWHVGTDLPAAPLGAMAVGRLHGAGSPQLIIATHGEGVLLLGADGALRQFRPADAAARDITTLLPLPSGDLLLATRQHGLLVWSAAGLALFRPDFADLQVTTLLADDNGGFWAGTRDRGLFHWSAGTVEHFGVEDGLPDADIESLAADGASVYAGTPVGVEELVQGRPHRLLAKDLFAQAILPASKTLTIATIDEGLRTVALERDPHLHAGAAADLQDNASSFVTADDSSAYAVSQDRISRRDSAGRWTTVVQAEPASLTDGNVSSLAFDGDGRLWIGYFDRGLDIWTPSATRHIEDDHLFCVNRMELDPSRQTMAVATANGLVLFDRDGKPRQVMTRRDGLIADHVTDVVFRPGGMALATPAGITFVDAGSAPQSLYAFQGLVNNHVYALAVQPDGDVLAGTLGGLSLLQNESVVRSLTIANSGLKHNWITAIVSDTRGGWSVGTYGGGVMDVGHDGSVHPVTPAFVVNPNAMLRTQQHLFAGTLGSGLWVESLASGRWMQVTSGLPSANVTAMAERDGIVYIGTDNGLVRIAERSLAP